jgi:hypothetical protein
MNCCKYSEQSHHKCGPQVAFVDGTKLNIGWRKLAAGRDPREFGGVLRKLLAGRAIHGPGRSGGEQASRHDPAP